MPKHANRSNRVSARRPSGRSAAKRIGVLALSGLWLAAGSAYAVTPLNTYFGPGLPIDNYFPQGIPGSADQPGVTVRSRLRSEYNAQGIREGAFIIRPGIDEQMGYNNNVVGGINNSKGSSYTSSGGTIAINSDYSRNNFGLTAGIDDTRYWDVPRMTHTDYNAAFGGGLDIGRGVLNGSVSYLSANEEPYDIGANGSQLIQLNKPLNFTDTDFRTSYSTTLGRFTVTPNVDYQLLRFAHGDFTGVPIGSENSFNQSLRDTNTLQGGVIGRYEFSEGRSAVLVLNGNYDHYIRGTNENAGIVDSTGATALTGLDYEVSGALTVRALVGYQQRFFNGNKYGNRGAPIGEGDVIWNPTGLTTVTASYARTIEDATTDTVTGYTYDRLGLIVDHELFRNILIQANGRYETANYQGSNLQQTNYGGGVGTTYLINRNLQLALSHQFLEHDSTGGQFGQHIVTFHVKFGL